MGGSSLVVQWLGYGAFTSRALGSIPGQGTKILQRILVTTLSDLIRSHTSLARFVP